MAAATQPAPALLTMEEYLRTSYRPDCDFVEGRLEERMGGTKHGLLQMQLGFWFISHQQDWHVRAIGELRTQVAADRVRLPDVAVVLDDEALDEELRTTPPLIAIEILSPEDRLSRVILRLQDFLTMGTPYVWMIDPVEQVAYTYSTHGLSLVDADRITLPDSPIYLDLPFIFSCLKRSSNA